MINHPIFDIGQTVAQYSVLDMYKQRRDWRYLVECNRCGHEREINQGALLDVQRRQSSGCPTCSHRKYTKDGLEYGESDRLRLWKSTDACIAEYNRLMRQWPVPTEQNGYWLWADHRML